MTLLKETFVFKGPKAKLCILHPNFGACYKLMLLRKQSQEPDHEKARCSCTNIFFTSNEHYKALAVFDNIYIRFHTKLYRQTWAPS